MKLKVLVPITNFKCQEHGCQERATHVIITGGPKSQMQISKLKDTYFIGCEKHARKYLDEDLTTRKKAHVIYDPKVCEIV